MNNNTVVPPPVDYKGQVINGRLIGDFVREDGYIKWNWSCVVHGIKAKRPMRVKDMNNRSKPFCCRNQKSKANGSWRGYEDISRTYINQVKNGAALRGHSYELEDKDLWNLWLKQEGKCAYTGWELTLGKDASLDRKDSSVGYVVSNIQWLHKDVNLAKQRYDEDYFIKMCEDIAENYGNSKSKRNPLDQPDGAN